jgi:hypothetical protein
MTVNTPNSGNFQQQISTAVVALRTAFDDLNNLNNYITSVGGTTFLEDASPAGIGLSAADANTVISTLGNLASLATQYNGGAQAPALNYRANSEPLWGGN